ncbi:MAG: hypothetical protein K6T83_00945 [Alicyclobacillus sp.]|nr:hypothetical protein [Alicyclobacillus sp.]
MPDPKWVDAIRSRPYIAPIPTKSSSEGKPERPERESFSAVLQRATASTDLPSAGPGSLRLSAHAAIRLQQRGMQLSTADLARLGQAVDQAQAKGSRDAYVLYGDTGFVVNVPNRTVITAIPSREDTIITNVDSVVVVKRLDL